MESEKAFRRRLAAAENMAVRQRNYRRSRDRALVRLANAHKEEYLEYLAQEKEKDEKEGKRWHNLAGTDADFGSSLADYLINTNRGDTSTNPQNKGNDV